MAEVTGRNPLAIRTRVLEEFEKVQAQIATNPELWRKLSFEAHKELCTVLGVNFIDYPEFEFWFSRFARGDFDLNYDKSFDPKTRSLTDLPLEIFKKIGENLEILDRLQLRIVCKDIRFQVDNWDPKVTKIFYCKGNNWRVCQTSRPELYWMGNFEQNRNNIFHPGFNRDPISFVMSVLKLPKLRLEELTIYEDDNWKKLIEELDESNRKLHVKKVFYPNGYDSSKIDLHFMIPGVLEEITLSNQTGREIYEIIESEQCQAAKMMYIESTIATSSFPLQALYNCPRFTLKLGGRPADGLKSKFLKRLMEYGKVQTCVLYVSKYRPEQSQILKYFNEPEATVPNFPSLRRYPIPETNEFYELEYVVEVDHYRRREEFVRLEKKQ
ncbi:hypothetical protein CRE_14872 [Caenorhabditis remanei]|uniref:F-box domain-containing protein n=1 Tax=Caenorhabditis remanei TaxID=31234 RepID=E3N1U2_CAERE|nr:hypothetical protein CRE_14872 [Caenorhabditis remanei]